MEKKPEISSQSSAKRKLTKEELLAGKCHPDDDFSNDPRFKSPDEILNKLARKKDAPLVNKKTEKPNPEPQIEKPKAENTPPVVPTRAADHPMPPVREEVKPEQEPVFSNPLFPQYFDEASANEKEDQPVVHPVRSGIQFFDLDEIRARFEREMNAANASAEMEKTNGKNAESNDVSADTAAPAFPKSASAEASTADSNKPGGAELAEMKTRYEEEISRWKEYEQSVSHWKDRVLQIVQHLKKELAETHTLKLEIQALQEALREKDEELEKLRSNVFHSTQHTWPTD